LGSRGYAHVWWRASWTGPLGDCVVIAICKSCALRLLREMVQKMTFTSGPLGDCKTEYALQSPKGPLGFLLLFQEALILRVAITVQSPNGPVQIKPTIGVPIRHTQHGRSLGCSRGRLMRGRDVTWPRCVFFLVGSVFYAKPTAISDKNGWSNRCIQLVVVQISK
jgi:hypothetical protein